MADTTNLTPQQKAQLTRQQNAEKRRQWREALDRQEKADRELVGEAMRQILRDQNATTREKVFATLTLDNIVMGTGIVPRRAAQLYDNDVDLTSFKKSVEQITE